METVNTFDGGLNLDFNKISQPKNTYITAENIRLTTYEGSSNVTLSNVLGQSQLSSIPDTSEVLKLVFTTPAPTTTPQTFTITINGISTSGTMVVTMDTIASTINTTLSLANFTASVSNDGTYLLLYSPNGTTISSFSVTYGVTTITGTSYVSPQSNLIPIGSTSIRNEIFLITTTETAQTPLTTGGIGQIWKLTYDKLTLVPTYTLLYNNLINLTTYHSIPPTAIQGRYENVNTKRIYWTDNFNQLRSFNTVSTINSFAIDPSLLNVQPPIDATIPILKVIGSGILKSGMYQAAYRLKNAKTVTFFSELSNLVQIGANLVAESSATGGANDLDYIGGQHTVNCNKSITWVIKDLDTDYERIEIVILNFDTLNGTPEIALTHDEPVDPSGTFTFTYTGNELIARMTTSEFLNQSFSFTHCKTITTKNNQLVAANIRNTKIDVDYDARAYRFQPSQNNFDLKDSQGTTTNYLASAYATVPETHDAINPNMNTYVCKENSTVLGGTGTNINYEFGTYSVKGDDFIQPLAVQNSAYFRNNPSYTTGSWNFGVIDQDYAMNSINDGVKYAYLAGIMKGYQRCEIYRFSIVFYDKIGRPLFAKWIGDIKMPEYSNTNSNPDSIASAFFGASTPDFRTSFVHNGSCYTQNLYVKFNVNIPQSIRPLVGGYRITRVEREQQDKTILGAGVISQMTSDGAQLYPLSASDVDFPVIDYNRGVDANRNAGNASPYNFTFDSPDFLLTSFPGYSPTDKIMISQINGLATGQTLVSFLPTTEPGGDPYQIYKYYDVLTTLPNNQGTNNSYTIDEAATLGYGNNSYVFSSSGPSAGWQYNNYTHSEATNTKSTAVGTNTLILGLSQPLHLGVTGYGINESSGKRAYATYYRPLQAQYGGNTYSDRSRNNYIPCGSFQPLNVTNQNTTSFTQEVLGGDIFLDVYDNQRIVKNFGTSITGRTKDNVNTQENFAMMWVCESTHNMNLRRGVHINKDLGVNLGSTGYGSGASIYETYDYNTVYSQENNFITYIPKPINFTALEEFDARIWVSEEKENGESSDSWGTFLPAKYYDAESNYGPINAIITFKDRVYFFQDDACGAVPISERVLMQTTNAEQLNVGIPDEVIQRPEYMSKTVGTKHQWSVTASEDNIYFFDIKNITPVACNGQTLRELPGLRSFLFSQLDGKVRDIDNAIYDDPTFLRNGIIAVADYQTSDIFFTFHNAQPNPQGGYTQFSKTVCWNEEIHEENGGWTSFMSFEPQMYIANKDCVISPNPSITNTLYLHDSGNYCYFYGQYFASKVSLIVNEHPKNTKVFTNLEWESEVLDTTDPLDNIDIVDETWTYIRVRDSFQNTDYQTLVNKVNLKRPERAWRYAIPRNILITGGTNFDILDPTNFNPTRLFKDFIRDKWCIIDLVYNNTVNNRRLVCPFITSKYLISPR
jgi:hypothetical protein